MCFSPGSTRVSAESVTPLTCPDTKKTSKPTKNIKQTNKQKRSRPLTNFDQSFMKKLAEFQAATIANTNTKILQTPGGSVACCLQCCDCDCNINTTTGNNSTTSCPPAEADVPCQWQQSHHKLAFKHLISQLLHCD